MITSPTHNHQEKNRGTTGVVVVIFMVAITVMIAAYLAVVQPFGPQIGEDPVKFEQTEEGVKVTLMHTNGFDSAKVRVDDTKPKHGDNTLDEVGESVTVQTNAYKSGFGDRPYETVTVNLNNKNGKMLAQEVFLPKLDTLPDKTLPTIVNSTN